MSEQRHVWVVMHPIDYEGETLVGVYESAMSAAVAAREFAADHDGKQPPEIGEKPEEYQPDTSSGYMTINQEPVLP